MSNRRELSQCVIEPIADRWTLAKVAELQDGGHRYQELNDALDGVSHKVLTDTLDNSNATGLLSPGSIPVASRLEQAGEFLAFQRVGRQLDADATHP
jgi:DNA-binding HxlR family transcriptional regulator